MKSGSWALFWKKSFPKNSSKFTKKYLCYSLFLILLKAFRLSGLQLYLRETPALVFQSQPFVDSLQNTYSWIIHKIHRKAPVLEFLFKQSFPVNIRLDEDVFCLRLQKTSSRRLRLQKTSSRRFHQD